MREIKFRGKSINNGKWIHGSLVGTDVIAGGYAKTWDDDLELDEWEKVDPETVGQFTGLLDANGVEIYEGDIVVYDDLFNPFILHGIVKFIEGSWIIDSEEDEDAVGLWSETAEVKVIGNIHDNPELLEEQQ